MDTEAETELRDSRRWPRRGLLAVTVVLPVIPGIALGLRMLTSEVEGDEQSTSARLIPVAARRPAPEFSVRTTSGASFSLRDARGKGVVVGFVTPYCLDCIADIKALKSVDEAMRGRGVEIVALDQGGLSDSKIVEYYREQLGGAPHHYAQDVGYGVAAAFRVRSTGTTIVIDPRGRIAYLNEGATDAPPLLRVVGRVIAT